MSNWRDEILKEFAPNVHAIIASADPDGLLAEPLLSQALDKLGFELLLCEDSVTFRFAFESRFRSRLDGRERINLIVVVNGDESVLNTLPFDVLAKAKRISLSLANVFPTLSYPVLRDLEPQYVNQLYEAQIRFKPGVLGENATKDFILRHIFEIAAELIKSDADLIRTLLRRHYRLQSIPRAFVHRLVQVLSENGRFAGWPITALFEDRSLFYRFLQERWPIFLGKRNSKVIDSDVSLCVSGPIDIPFDDPDVRVYIDNLFVEGLLQPVEWSGVPEAWALAGIRNDAQFARDRHFEALLDMAEREMPVGEARHGDWFSFARIWAEVNLLSSEIGTASSPATLVRFSNLRAGIDSCFCEWLQKRIGSLSSLPASQPVMVHHVARFLSNQLETAGKLALIVVDGLAFDQWLNVQREISKQRPSLRYDEYAVFAWVPTITSVSRQSIFSGKAPLFFPSSIYSTGREAALWEQFWGDYGLGSHEIAYQKGLGDLSTLDQVDAVLSQPKLKVFGAVVDKVDRIMHGMELGANGMHNQVRQWANEGFMSALLDLLSSRGFTVFLTADHGNVESIGVGRPKEGVTAEIRGERVRIYSDSALRAAVADKFPAAISWKPIGLPEDFLPLLSAGRTAFVSEGVRTVAHGGVTLEETIVPLVKIIGGKS
jgi:PglZ domain